MALLGKVEEILVAICLACMVILNAGNVIGRYVLGKSWAFAGELLMILFAWIIMLGSAIVYKRREHLGLPLLVERSPVRWQKILIIFACVSSVVLICFLALSGYYMVADQISFGQRTSVLGLPQWIAGASIPLGALFLLGRVIEATVREVRRLNDEEAANA